MHRKKRAGEKIEKVDSPGVSMTEDVSEDPFAFLNEPVDIADTSVNTNTMRRPLRVGIVILCCGLLCIGGFFVWRGSGSVFGKLVPTLDVPAHRAEAQTVYVKVPDITGKTVDDARKTLNDMGLGIRLTDYVPSDGPEDMVVSQDIEAGTEVEEHTTVGYGCSVAVRQSVLGDVTKCSLVEAKAKLYAMGFTNVKVSTKGSWQQYGQVVSMTPEFGNIMKVSEQVELVVCTGKKKGSDTVPDFEGLTVAEAVKKAQKAHLVLDIGNTDYCMDDPIISQDVKADSKTDYGSIVVVKTK